MAIGSPNARRRMRPASGSGTGPASYDSAARPTLAIPGVTHIDKVGDVQMWALGYAPMPVSVSGNVVTYAVYNPSVAVNSHSHTVGNAAAAGGHSHAVGNAATSADHQHDITPAQTGNAATRQLYASAAALGVSAAGITTLANAVDAGGAHSHTVGNAAAAGAHSHATGNTSVLAAAAAAPGTEVPNTTALNAVTFYAMAMGL